MKTEEMEEDKRKKENFVRERILGTCNIHSSKFKASAHYIYYTLHCQDQQFIALPYSWKYLTK